MRRWLKESKCPRCGVSGTTKCNKDNGYCAKCDDQTSYDYCTPKPPKPQGKIGIEPIETEPGRFRLTIWAAPGEGITDIIEGPMRFIFNRALAWAEPGGKLGVRKVQK